MRANTVVFLCFSMETTGYSEAESQRLIQGRRQPSIYVLPMIVRLKELSLRSSVDFPLPWNQTALNLFRSTIVSPVYLPLPKLVYRSLPQRVCFFIT
jgi:hypothetical protein